MEKTTSSPNLGMNCFRHLDLLEKFSVEELQHLQEISEEITLPKGARIYEQDTYSRGFYLLTRGKVMIYNTNHEGVENIIYIYSGGEAFGYRPLLCDEKHAVTAETLEECQLYFLSKEKFASLLQQSSFSSTLLQSLSFEFNVWVNKISIFANKSVKERVAVALILLREIYLDHGQEANTLISLSKQNIAKYIGSSFETVVRVFHLLKEDHLVESVGRKIKIINYEKLLRMANLEQVPLQENRLT